MNIERKNFEKRFIYLQMRSKILCKFSLKVDRNMKITISVKLSKRVFGSSFE